MGGMKTRIKTLVFFGMLCLIVIGTAIFKYELIDLTPGYADNNYIVEARAGAQTQVKAIKTGDSLIVNPKDQAVVAIVKSKKQQAEDIQYPEIKEMVAGAVEMAGGFAGLIKNGHTVVIKPNLVTPIDYTLPNWNGRPLAPEVNGTTTDYRVTRAIVELVRQYNPKGKVYVMEGSAFPTRQCMGQLNYTPKYIPGVDEFICIEEDSGYWREYDSPKLAKVKVKDPLLVKEVYMNKRYKEADVIISVPALKTHWTEVVSGSIKNTGIGATPATIYGGVRIGDVLRNSGIDHEKVKLDKWIHDWYMARPIEFAIIDGLQGIQNGPTPCFEMTRTSNIKQDQMNSRLIIAGRDCVAVDTVSSLIMQWDPAVVGYLGHLEKSGAGKSNVASIRVVGKQVDEVRQDFKGTAPEGKFAIQAPPQVEIKSAVVKDDLLTVTLAAGPQTVKIDVYVEGYYISTVLPMDPQNWTIKAKGMDSKKFKTDIVLKCFDRYLNCTEKQIRVLNDPKLIEKNIVLLVDGSNYIARKTANAPVIDGLDNDPCWAQAEWKDLKYSWGSGPALPASEDFSGRYKLVWTPEKLYLLAEISDDALVDSHPDPLVAYWDDDALEVFIDEDHSGGEHTMNYNAFAYHIALDYNVADLMKANFIKPGLFNRHITCRRSEGKPVSVWEAEISIYDAQYDDQSDNNKPVTLFAGKELGFGLAYCDSDKQKRENFIGSMPIPTGQDYAWQNADVFTTLKLAE